MRYPCGVSASLALLVATLLLASCSSVTDFDRFHRGEDGGTGRDGSIADGGTDARNTDAGPCEDPVPEICNDADDDCDGMVDEGFDLDGDAQNCGSCGRSCPEVPNSSPGCAGGECAAQCDVGWGDCDGDYISGCETDLTSPDDCTACGTVCAAGSFCSASGCVTDCPGAEEVCGRTCVDTESSATHCGECGNACPSRDHSTPICDSGSCQIVCDAGWDDCDGDPTNGCEVDLTTISDCGSCGTVCSYPNGVAACTAGACELMACNAGYSDCDLDDSTGCEADLGTVATCGACTTACAEPSHSTAMCTASGCSFGCDSGWADCNSDASDGCEADLSTAATCGACGTSCSGGTPLCESGTCVSGCSGSTPTLCSGSCVNTATDPLHCGACGSACPDRAHSSPTCSSSTCGFTCDSGYADCDAAADGCETDIRTVSSCGGCGVTCDVANGTPTCSTGTCAVASCDTGWDDCDSDVANGCETSLTTVTDCRACGTICTVANGTPTCSATGCAIGSCDSGWDDCNGSYADGCEALLATYYRDLDGDGFGTSGTTMLGCPGVSMSGWAAIAGDCDDANNARYPGATEVCNDVDDDCNGTIDDGFECRLGSTQNCTVSSPGCIVVGTQSCTSTCSWSACMPPAETCNRLDDDCNGFVDENQLAADSSFRVHAGGNPKDVRVAWSPNLGRGAAIYWAADGAGANHLYLTQFLPDGSVFPSISLDSGASDWDADVTSDGTAWAVVYSRTGAGTSVRYGRVLRVSATGTITNAGSFPGAESGTTGPLDPRIVGANDGSDKLGVVWLEKKTVSGSSDYIKAASFGGGSLLSNVRLDTTITALTEPAITALAGDEFAAVWGRIDAGGGGISRYRVFNAAGTVGSVSDLHTDTTPERFHEIAYAAGPGRVIIGWTEMHPAPAAPEARWSHGPASSGGGSGELTLPTGSRALPGWAADAAYSIAYAGTTTGGALRRFRPADGMAIAGDVPIGAGEVADMASLEAGAYRHVLAFISGDAVHARFIGCM